MRGRRVQWSKPNKRTGERAPNLFGIYSLLQSISFTSWKLYFAAFHTVRCFRHGAIAAFPRSVANHHVGTFYCAQNSALHTGPEEAVGDLPHHHLRDQLLRDRHPVHPAVPLLDTND